MNRSNTGFFVKNMLGTSTLNDGSVPIQNGTITPTKLNISGNWDLMGGMTLYSNIIANGNTITPTMMSYLYGISSNVQTQLNTLASTMTNLVSSNNAWTGTNTFNTSLPTSTLTPSSNTQLATKVYVDTQIVNNASLVTHAGNNVWTGTNTFNSHLPTSTQTPSNNTDLTTKTYVDSQVNTKASLSQMQGNNNTWTGTNTFTGDVTVANTTDTTSSTTGALVVSGGVGVAYNVNCLNLVGNHITCSSLQSYNSTTLSSTYTNNQTFVNSGSFGTVSTFIIPPNTYKTLAFQVACGFNTAGSLIEASKTIQMALPTCQILKNGVLWATPTVTNVNLWVSSSFLTTNATNWTFQNFNGSISITFTPDYSSSQTTYSIQFKTTITSTLTLTTNQATFNQISMTSISTGVQTPFSTTPYVASSVTETALTPSITNTTPIGIGGNVKILNTLASTSTTTGALVCSGGVGIAGNLYIGGTLNIPNIYPNFYTPIYTNLGLTVAINTTYGNYTLPITLNNSYLPKIKIYWSSASNTAPFYEVALLSTNTNAGMVGVSVYFASSTTFGFRTGANLALYFVGTTATYPTTGFYNVYVYA